MFKLISPLLLLLLLVAPAAGKEPVRVFDGVVVDLSDGDTITVLESSGARTRVRLHGIDAPEMQKKSNRTGRLKRESQPYGEEALQSLTEKIGGRRVRVEVMDTGRKAVIATVWLANRNINLEMVRDGCAWVLRRHFDGQPAAEYLQAEDHARHGEHGLWKQHHPQPPWKFREEQKLKYELLEFGLF